MPGAGSGLCKSLEMRSHLGCSVPPKQFQVVGAVDEGEVVQREEKEEGSRGRACRASQKMASGLRVGAVGQKAYSCCKRG